MAKEIINEGIGELNTELIVQGLSSLSKNVKESVVSVSLNEARFLVDTYYQCQAARIAADGQIRSITQSLDDQDERIPLALKWVSANMNNQEVQIKKMLEAYAKSLPVGQWLMATKGIGPVLAAGCLSYFDIKRVTHYGQFVSFCGLNDYNNPWLGKTGASQKIKDLKELLKESDDQVKATCKDVLVDKEKGKKFFSKIAKEDHFGAGLYKEICAKDAEFSDIFKSVMSVVEDEEAAEDFLIRHYVNDKAVTNTVIYKLLTILPRRYEVVVNGLDIVIFGKKEKIRHVKYTMSDLESYLAKPPYSKNAKQLIYLIGEQFIKVMNRGSLYGKLYKERKAYEIANNEAGLYKKRADEALAEKNYGKDTKAYEAYIQGKLPAGHIHARCKRYAVKIFISHLFEAMYMDHYGTKVPYEIYPIDHMEHTDYIPPEVPFDRFISYK